MAQPNDAESLQSAWRALSDHATGSGWRTIEIARHGPVRVLAGRHFPGNEEALLAGFSTVALPAASRLPSGRGFTVSRLDLEADGIKSEWISLARHDRGNRDLFSAMAVDVLGAFRTLREGCEQDMLRAFLARITAWQDFMEREREDVLGREAEVGLFGELVMLRLLLASGLPPTKILDSWQGPMDGTHDFVLGQGAIEVKSTIAPVGFSATINSLEQLDESLVSPLFLACVRMPLQENGITLPQLISEIRASLGLDPVLVSLFESRLLHAGYLHSHSDLYSRKYAPCAPSIFPVNGIFPRITRRTVLAGVRKVRYEVELDGLGLQETTLATMLEQLGEMATWS